MGGNIYPATSPVVGIPGQPTNTSANNVAPINTPTNTNDWTSFLKPDAGAYGTQYVGPNGQLMTYAIGGDDLATKLQTDAWNKANPNNTIEFDAQASNPYGGFTLNNGLQALGTAANIGTAIYGLGLQSKTLDENITARKNTFNAQADQQNMETNRYDNNNKSVVARNNQLSNAKRTYTNRAQIAKV